jgi:hypothetical protein
MTNLTDFLTAFFPDEDDLIYLRAFKAKDAPDAPDNRPLVEVVTRRRLATDAELQNRMIAANKTVLKLLVEGNSIRSTERITGVHRDTIIDLLVLAGEKCERLLNEKIKGLAVRDVQADEMWGYVGMKEKTKKLQLKSDDTLGDAYTFVAMERHTKLVLAWHLGRRNTRDTVEFTEKLHEATDGRF